jgi:hypothetical protein
MRILDLGVAAGYAILCISLISLLSPYSLEGGAIVARSDVRATSAVVGYIQTVGLPFLATAPPSQFCSSLLASSNATVIYGGEENGYPCRPAPPYFLGSSSFRFAVSGNQVEIEAWVAGR